VKKILSIFVIFLCAFVLVGCETRTSTTTELIVVPDIGGVSQTSAETLLLDRSLIPVIEYMYSKDVSDGIAIFTDPEAFKEVDADTRVTVYVSKGEWPYLISSESANIYWYSVPGSSGDVYEFYNPEIIEGTIEIEITVTYNSSYLMEWEDKFDDGWGWGSASISPDFDNSAYLWIEYETKTILSGVAQTITISVDADELGVNKPTELYANFYVHIDGDDYNVEVNFEIIW